MNDTYIDALVAHLRATRQAERDVFDALDPQVRDAPMRPGDWSPKDHQAHLSAWKARQADRIAATREGRPPLTDEREDDEINAELQAARADWDWAAVEAEADEIAARLESEVRAIDPATLRENERLVGGLFGNGPFHALAHFGWLLDAGIGDARRVEAFAEEEERLIADSSLSDRDLGLGLYNLACSHAVARRVDRARPLLRKALQLRPDLAEWARQDPDLEGMRSEIDALLA